ncbi:SSI family serine proteinase inhibitor [Candidatus Blastococcus massiliensis]|uniref:SSI family serine proteinase inhibitor n=1 Tax=Candidatus Blastococcus massiliensis TaxID=1470358 RepID=UPI0004B01E92|nr:SSI family serine proteinase inhibitor [Candidatus Blastococcus massiliensis]
MRRFLPLLVPAAVLLLAAGCGSDDDGGAAAPATSSAPEEPGGDPAAGGISQADNDLQVEIDLGDGSAPQTWTLTCVGFVEGNHPSAQAACDHLAGIERPFAPLPDDVFCTQQYGGPETAHVLGRWAGEPVDLQLSRVDGCTLAQWDSLVPFVPAVASGDLSD